MTNHRVLAPQGRSCGLARVVRGARLYWLLVSAGIRARMEYKVSFISSVLIQAASGLYDFLLIAVILWRFKSVHGWTVYEVGLLYAVSRVGYGLYRVFGNELEHFETYIVKGDFDTVLTRPWPSLFVILARNVEFSHMSLVVQGAGVGAVSASFLIKAGALCRWETAWLLYAALSSACLYMTVSIATASCAFHIVRIEELQVLTQSAPATAGLYPLDIYPEWLRYALLSVIPLGFGNYVPIRFLLGKGGTWVSLVAPAAASIIGFVVAKRLWDLGESRYHSTGS